MPNISIDLSSNQAWITNAGNNNASVIDTSTFMKVTTIAVGTSPRGVAINPPSL
ncbi:YncE family protein [Bacillus cereus]|uniref:YncE family protein n=1 Tax=Bacillus cereus TaxID=1396 RepID=UPI002116C2F6|nr:hypothetical protein [Bacillus cereus]